MNQAYTVKLSNATGTRTVELMAGQGESTIIEVHGPLDVELLDTQTGRAPQGMTVRRVDQDLHIVLGEGDPENPDLILQGFHESCDNRLVARAEDGMPFEYPLARPAEDACMPPVAETASSAPTPGPDALAPAHLPSSAASWLLGGLGLAGIAAIAASDKSSAGSAHPVSPLAPVAPVTPVEPVIPVMPPVPGASRPPDAPVIVSSIDRVELYLGEIASGVPTNDAAPLLSGSAQASSVVTVSDGGVVIATTMADASGQWSFALPALLGQGVHAITATATDAAGNASTSSAAWNLQIDTVAPSIITSGSASAGENTAIGTVIHTVGSTDASAVTYAITGGPDAALFSIDPATGKVFIQFKPDYENPVDSGKNNVYEYSTTATDAAGNTSTQDSTLTITDVYEKPVNLITNGAQPGLNWLIDPGIYITGSSAHNGYQSGLNSTLSGGLFAASTTPVNTTGAVYFDSDQSGALGRSVVAIDKQPLLLNQGQFYDFSMDVMGRIAANNPNASVAQWVLIPVAEIQLTQPIAGTRVSTGGIGADPAVPVVSAWTTIQASFENILPTGQYRLALTWSIVSGSSADLAFDRIYLAPHQAAAATTPASAVAETQLLSTSFMAADSVTSLSYLEQNALHQVI